MKNPASKISLIFIALCFFLNTQITKAQENPVNLFFIFLKLNAQTEKSAEEINQELIEKIKKDKVNFILTSEDENNLKNSGASDLLITAINENASEKVKIEFEQKLYGSSNCSYNSCPQMEKRIELGKRFIKVFSNDPDYKLQIEYLRKAIPKKEQEFAKYKQEQELDKVLSEIVVKNIRSDELKKEIFCKFSENHTGNAEQKKIALEAAKSFIEKFGEDQEIKDLIDYFKKRISELEK